MKVTIPLRKLSDLDVKFVSLVERGANRIPFRIIKSQEKDMSIDLSKLGFRVKKAAEEAKPGTASVTAVILSSGDDTVVTKVQKTLADTGIELTHHTLFEDGTVALHKEDAAIADGTVIRMNPNFAVVLTDMGKNLDNLKKSAFGEMADAKGYFEGPAPVLEMANDVIRAGVQKADSPIAAGTLVRDSMEGVQQYLGYLTEVLPTGILKSEVAIYEIVKAGGAPGKKGVNPFAKPAEGTAAEEAVEAAAEATEVANGAADTVKAKKEEAPEAVAVVAAPVVATGDVAEVSKASMSAAEKEHMATITDPGEKMEFMRMTPDERAACMAKAKKPVAKEDASVASNAQMEKVLKAMSEMASAVATLTQNVSVLSADITSIKKSTEEKIDVIAKKAETATTAVRGTVLASAPAGDPYPVTSIKKVDSDPRTGVFDTAMLGRNR